MPEAVDIPEVLKAKNCGAPCHEPLALFEAPTSPHDLHEGNENGAGCGCDCGRAAMAALAERGDYGVRTAYPWQEWLVDLIKGGGSWSFDGNCGNFSVYFAANGTYTPLYGPFGGAQYDTVEELLNDMRADLLRLEGPFSEWEHDFASADEAFSRWTSLRAWRRQVRQTLGYGLWQSMMEVDE